MILPYLFNTDVDIPGCAAVLQGLVDIQCGMEGWGIVLERWECSIVEEGNMFRCVVCQ